MRTGGSELFRSLHQSLLMTLRENKKIKKFILKQKKIKKMYLYIPSYLTKNLDTNQLEKYE